MPSDGEAPEAGAALMNVQPPRRVGMPQSPSAQLATVLRQGQWDIDHVAFNLPSGRVSRPERERLADALAALAELLRESG